MGSEMCIRDSLTPDQAEKLPVSAIEKLLEIPGTTFSGGLLDFDKSALSIEEVGECGGTELRKSVLPPARYQGGYGPT